MEKEIKFSLVYRDMFQSSGKFQPLAEQLEKVAPAIIEMGCFARIETNGGAFEQVNLMAGENPNKAVRSFTKYFNEAGIQTHMLDRALNGLRMFPVPADVRRLMYKVKKAQGVDITRIFCGLNDARNIIPSIKYALEAGMIPQATLCITSSPVHTVEYYSNLADELIEAGATEICLKDMAGIGRPAFLGRLTKSIKEKHPEIIIQYHGHTYATSLNSSTISSSSVYVGLPLLCRIPLIPLCTPARSAIIEPIIPPGNPLVSSSALISLLLLSMNTPIHSSMNSCVKLRTFMYAFILISGTLNPASLSIA